ncbi:MAG: hypothetical protein R3E96_04010 [Planctomycetota bacterium]
MDPSPFASPAQELGGAWRDDLTGGMFVMALISVVAALANGSTCRDRSVAARSQLACCCSEAVLCRLPVATPRRESV